MAKQGRIFVGGCILLVWSCLAGVVADSNDSAPPGFQFEALAGAPVFTVSTTNQVVWKDAFEKNVSINISSSQTSDSQSILKWCTHVITSEQGVERVSNSQDASCLSYSPDADHMLASGEITVEANASTIPAIEMPLNWSEIRPQDEYLVAAKLVGLKNANVYRQPRVAMFIYGVASGTCPPGTVNQNERMQPPLTFYEPNATLQDIYLRVCPSDVDCSSSSAASQLKFLHPAFSPAVSRYSALVPHSSSNATLVLRSINIGDRVFFNASRCSNLPSLNVTIAKSNQEVFFNITPQLGTVCNLTISVFPSETREDPALSASALSPQIKHSLPYNVTITLARLMDPNHLQLNALVLANGTHTLVLCGNYTPPVLPFPQIVTRADPYSFSCTEGSCFTVTRDQLPQRFRLLPDSKANLSAYISTLPSEKPLRRFIGSKPSFEHLSVTIKAKNASIYNLINYQVLVIHNTSDPSVNTEKVLCSTRTNAASDVIPGLAPLVTADNTSLMDQRGLKFWLFGTRDKAFPKHPAQDDACLVCPSGTHSSQSGSDACQYCPPGYYSNLSQWPAPLLSSCKPCKPGSFSSWGARECRKCWPGTYARNNGSTACELCPPGNSTRADGAAWCDVRIATDATTDWDYDTILRFVVELTGTFHLDQLPSITGINSTGPVILSYLMRRDVATWLNVSTENVDTSLPVATTRNLIKIDVSAKLKDENDAARSSKQLTSDDVVGALSAGETVKYSGASQVNVRILTKTELHRQKRRRMQQLHAILWPVLLGSLALGVTTWWLCRRYLRRRNRKTPLQMQDTTGFIRWLHRDSVSHSSLSAGDLAVDLELPDVSTTSAISPSTISPTPGVQRHRKQFIMNYSSDESP